MIRCQALSGFLLHVGHINDAKSENANVILADGSQLSTSTSGMSYRDISGQLGDSVRAIQMQRVAHVTTNRLHICQPLPPSPEGIFDSMEHSKRSTNSPVSMLDAIANMLGFVPPPPTTPSNGDSAAQPMQVDSNSNATQQSTAVKPDPANSDGVSDGSAGNPTGDSKPSVIPLQAKSESTTAAPMDGVVNLSEAADLKPPVMPMPNQATSDPTSGSATVEVIDLDDDDGDSEVENKENTVANANKSQVKAEKSVAKRAEAKSWLDEDSDDDSICHAVSF